ncbi:hypothetical protein evm_009954 [Chilo suppressalis]|nr:hypothetical protein evm_009954 [Chilo suppressalis]
MKYYKITYYLIITHSGILALWKDKMKKTTKSIEEMVSDYEDDMNSMIAISEKENVELYEEFYEDLDNRITTEQSMNMIFFGPPISFMRLDTETILHIFVHTKKHLVPISRALLAWDMLTDGKTAAFLQGREFLAFGSLLNVIPEEDLYYVNFGDPSVLKYFSSSAIQLRSRKYGILAAAYKRYFGDSWYKNSSQINELGYLLCGFPSSDLKQISPHMFLDLSIDVLNKLDKCKPYQSKILYNIATSPDAFGEPYKWSSHEIGRLGSLFNCIPADDISSIQLEAVPSISDKVMKSMHIRKLKYFTKQQILRMNPKARRVFILRMQLKSSLDMSQVSRQRGRYNVESRSTVLFILACIVTLV